jgi:hypothetical protein
MVCVLPAINGDHRNVLLAKVLITRITKLEKLHEKKMEAQNNVGANQ